MENCTFICILLTNLNLGKKLRVNVIWIERDFARGEARKRKEKVSSFGRFIEYR